MKYKGYYAEIKYSDEDGCFCGRIEGLDNDTISFEGNTVQELRKDFEEAIDHYLEVCQQNNLKPEKQYKGNFNVRIEAELHEKATLLAKSFNMSLNQFIAKAIKEKIENYEKVGK